MDEEPREQGELLVLDQFVLDRIKAVVLEPLQTVCKLFVALWVWFGFRVTQHRVPGYVHRVAGDVIAHKTQTVGHVVVLTAPAPE